MLCGHDTEMGSDERARKTRAVDRGKRVMTKRMGAWI
jgi:hypothetical protein